MLCFVLFMVSGEHISAQVINVTGGAVFTVSTGTVVNADTVITDNFPSVIDNQGTINATVFINNGTLQGNGTYKISSLLTNTGTFTIGTNTIEFNGSVSQSIPVFPYYNVTVNNSSGASLTGNTVVAGTLTLTSGVVSTSSYLFTIGLNGTVTRTSGYINGSLQRAIPTGNNTIDFDIGDASVYTPVSLLFHNVSDSGLVTAATTAGDHPDVVNSGVNPAASVNRYWTLTDNSSVTFDSLRATFTFDPTDVDGGANTSAFIVAQNDGSWSQPTPGIVTSTSTQGTEITSFGDFVVGESSAGTVLSTATGGNWSSTSTWVGGVVPALNDHVIIATTNGDSVYIDANTANLRDLQIVSNAILSSGYRLRVKDSLINNGSLNMYSGSEFRVTKNTKWNGTGSFNLFKINLNGYNLQLAFDSPNTIHLSAPDSAIYGGTLSPDTNSTIDYSGILPQIINTSVLSFYNITINNGFGVTFDAAVTGSNIGGDITVQSGTLQNSGLAMSLASGKNFTVENGGTFVLSGTSAMVSVSGGGTKSFGATSTVEYGGTTQTVSSETYGNLSFTNGVAAAAGGVCTVMGNLTIESGAIFDASTYDHIVKGNWTNNGGTFTPNSRTITFNSTTSAQSINGSAASQAFNNILVDKSATTLSVGGSTTTVTMNDLTITSGTFDVAASTTANGTVTLTGGTLSLASNTFTANGTVTVTSGTLSSNAAGIFVYGQTSAGQNVLALNYGGLQFSDYAKTLPAGTIGIAGTFTPGSGTGHTITGSTISFNGTGAQSTGVFSFNNLTINNDNGLSLTGPVTINSTLTLTTGRISTGSDSVIIASGGSVSRTAGHIAGKLTKYINGSGSVTFEVGDAIDDSTYSPIDVAFNSVSGPLALTASTQSGDDADILNSGISASKSVNRTWRLTNATESIGTYDATLHFLISDMDGGSNYNNYAVAKYLDNNWTSQTVGTKTSTSTQATSIDSLGVFQIGEPETGTPLTWDGGGDASSWNDANNWNPNQVPDSTNTVTISSAVTVLINTVARANNVVLNNAGATLRIQPTKSLQTKGNLQIIAGTLETREAFPTVGGSVDLSGGTVEYSGTGAQSIAAESYNNLTISTDRGGSTITFPAGTVTVSGILTFSATTVTYNVTGNTIDFNDLG